MIHLIITLVPSVLWILYRSLQILQTPAEELVADLKTQIPHTPQVCVDSITASAAIIHWDIEIRPNENLYYVLVVNHQEVATISSTLCKLDNLGAHLYEIQIVAINLINNFKSQSAPVYLHPGEPNMRQILDTETANIAPTRREPEMASLLTTTPADVPQMGLAELTDSLVAFQNEIAKVNAEYRAYREFSENELDALTATYNLLRKEYTDEHDSKVKKELSVKHLEKRKNELTFKKSKIKATSDKLSVSIETSRARVAEFHARVADLLQEKSQLKDENEERAKIDLEVGRVKTEIQQLKKNNEILEDCIKAVLHDKKAVNSTVASLRPLMDVFGSPPPENETSIFLKDGSINPRASDALQRIFEVAPQWQEDIMRDIHHYKELSSKWKEVYRYAIQRYVNAKNAAEAARAEREPGYEPVRTNEYQASIDFGGYGNALLRKKRKEDSFHSHYGKVYEDETDVRRERPHRRVDSREREQKDEFKDYLGEKQLKGVSKGEKSTKGKESKDLGEKEPEYKESDYKESDTEPNYKGIDYKGSKPNYKRSDYLSHDYKRREDSEFAASPPPSYELSQSLPLAEPMPEQQRVVYEPEHVRLYEDDLYETPQSMGYDLSSYYSHLGQNLGLQVPGSLMWGHSVSSSTSSLQLQNKLNDYQGLNLRGDMLQGSQSGMNQSGMNQNSMGLSQNSMGMNQNSMSMQNQNSMGMQNQNSMGLNQNSLPTRNLQNGLMNGLGMHGGLQLSSSLAPNLQSSNLQTSNSLQTSNFQASASLQGVQPLSISNPNLTNMHNSLPGLQVPMHDFGLRNSSLLPSLQHLQPSGLQNTVLMNSGLMGSGLGQQQEMTDGLGQQEMTEGLCQQEMMNGSMLQKRPISPLLSPTPLQMSGYNQLLMSPASQPHLMRGLWDDALANSQIWRDGEKKDDFLPFGNVNWT